MSNSLEWMLEEWALQQVAAAVATGNAQFSALSGIQARHHDDGNDASPTRIFFEAVQGEQDPAFQGNPGVPVYVTMMTAEYRTTDRDATVTDPIFAALLKVFTQQPMPTVAASANMAGGLWF